MKILIILILLGIVLNEKWYGEITGYDINDGKKYAGKSGITITHFYLCGNRQYWVHYKGKNWSSLTYEGCRPAGNGSPIDGICISGGMKYRVKLKSGKWTNEVTRCNLREDNSDPTAFAGVLGEEISAIAVSGGDKYSVAEGGDSSEFEECAKRVFNNLFGYKIKFEKYSEKLIFSAGANIVTLQLIQTYEFKKDGEITFNIENGEIKGFTWNKKIERNELKIGMKKISGFTPIEFKTTIQAAYKNGMHNGKVSATFDFIKREVIIDAISQINADRFIYSGGFRITISLHDDNNKKFMKLLSKIPALYPEEEKKKILRNPGKVPIIEFDKLFDNLFNQSIKKEYLIAGAVITAEILILYYTGFSIREVLQEELYEIGRVVA